jgi:glutamyl-tRNA synthetase
MPNITAEMFESKKLSQEQVRQSLQFAIWRLANSHGTMTQ